MPRLSLVSCKQTDSRLWMSKHSAELFFQIGSWKLSQREAELNLVTSNFTRRPQTMSCWIEWPEKNARFTFSCREVATVNMDSFHFVKAWPGLKHSLCKQTQSVQTNTSCLHSHQIRSCYCVHMMRISTAFSSIEWPLNERHESKPRVVTGEFPLIPVKTT